MADAGSIPERPWPTADPDAFRLAVREWISRSYSTSITVREWWRRLAAAGLTVPTWAVPFGGLGATAAIQAVIEEELAAIEAVAPPQSGIGVQVIGPTLRQHATPAQFDRLRPAIINGSQFWCLLFDEPDTPADLSALLTSATRTTDDRWVVAGVKSTTDARLADRGFVLARTELGSTGRQGLSCFTFTMDQPGVSIRVLDDGTSIVILQHTKVGSDDLIGPEGHGWQVAQTALAHVERSLAGRIRRGLVDVLSGPKAGYLDGSVAAAHQAHIRRRPPGGNRRT
jgi:alkylation response protein AidB-like acyl-CoA dehydrogenase